MDGSGPLETLDDFAVALATGALSYHVQPIWDVAANAPIGVELLLRSRQGGRFEAVPQVLIAEAARLYGADMGPSVRIASEAASTFVNRDRTLFASFNTTQGFLEHDAGEGTVWLEQLTGGMPPGRLVFEIVETAEIASIGRTRHLLEALRRAGHRIALDDFGAGYSDLRRLAALPLDILKLDRVLVQRSLEDPAAMASIRDAVALAGERGIDVIAEGVETEAQSRAMSSEGIDLQQGYLHGRPDRPEVWAARLLG